MNPDQSKPIYCIPGNLTSLISLLISLFSTNKSNKIGDRLSKLDEKLTGGNGTYTHGGYIYSSLAGVVNVKEDKGYVSEQISF